MSRPPRARGLKHYNRITGCSTYRSRAPRGRVD